MGTDYPRGGGAVASAFFSPQTVPRHPLCTHLQDQGFFDAACSLNEQWATYRVFGVLSLHVKRTGIWGRSCRDCVFGVGTRYGLEVPGTESILYNGHRVSFPGVNRPGHGVDHPPPSSADVKERVEL